MRGFTGLSAIPLVCGFLVLVARRPEDLFRPGFVWEEAAAFYLPALSGATILDPWAAYLNVVPRLGYVLSPWLPPSLAPIPPTLLAYAVTLGVAGFIASARVPVPWMVGAFVLVLPGVSDMHGSVLNANWYLTLYLVALSIARRHWSDYPLAALASLSGPAAIFLWPLFWRSRLLWVVSAGALLQLAVVLSVDRSSSGSFDPAAFVYHLGVVPLFGERVSLLVPWFVGLATLALGALLVKREQWPWLYSAMVLALAGSVLSGVYLDPVAGERYFLLVTVAWGVVILSSTSRVAWVLGAMLAIGVVADFRLPADPDTGWPPACMDAPPCYLPMHPPEWSVTWTVPYDAPEVP